MQIVVWIVIILLAIFLIWLLRRWIRRIIFILILLVLAFFIYGIFNPSGAARLRYNVRTFPQRVSSWISSGKEFSDYDSYKLNLPSIKDVDLNVDVHKDSDLDLQEGLPIDSSTTEEDIDSADVSSVEKNEEKITDYLSGETLSSITPRFVNIKNWKSSTVSSLDEEDSVLTGYSKADLLGIIGKYVEDHLGDDTDILVTIEYDDLDEPSKITLKTQKKGESGTSLGNIPRLSVEKVFDGLYRSKYEAIVIDEDNSSLSLEEQVQLVEDKVEDNTQVENNKDNKQDNSEQKHSVSASSTNKSSQSTINKSSKSQSTKAKSSNGLTQKDMEDAAEVFSLLIQ